MVAVKKFLSIVVPVFNEEGSIAKLHREIKQVCDKISKPYEIIFVNDGSKDSTLTIIKTLSPLVIINFRKNFGQTAAMDAGIKQAQGKYIVALDGDGQNDPKDIPRLIKKLEKDDLDVVSGWRRKRKDKFSKKIASRLAGFMRKLLINDGIHDSGCTLKIYKKECFENVELFGEMHRFIPAILTIKGFKIGEIEVNHRPRQSGQTKYNWRRGVKGNLDMLSIWFWKKFSRRPLHLFGTIGLIIIFIGLLAAFASTYNKIFYNVGVSNSGFTVIAMFSLLIGTQFFVFGLLADILSKIYFAGTTDTPYAIKEVLEK